MNTAPTPASTPSTSGNNATGQTSAGPPADAFALLFGSVQGAPLLVPSAPISEQLASDDPPAVGADLSGWLQQLPLSPLVLSTGDSARDAGAQPASLLSATAATAIAPDSGPGSAPTWSAADLVPLSAAPPSQPVDAAQLLASRAPPGSTSMLPNAGANVPTAASLSAAISAAAKAGPADGLAGKAPGTPGDTPRAAPTASPQIQSALITLASAQHQGPQEGLQAAVRPGEAVATALLQRTELRGSAVDSSAAAHAASSTASPPAQALAVALPPGSAPRIDQAFAEGMAIRLQWMSQQQVGRVEIQLHPEDLGSIDVQIEFEGKAIRAEFQSPVADVRHLLESTLPRLRELLEAHGLQLRHADVGSGQGQGQPGSQRQEGSASLPGSRGAVREEVSGEQRNALPRGAQHGGQLSEYA